MVGVTSISGRLLWNCLRGALRPRREAFTWATTVGSYAAMAFALAFFTFLVFSEELQESGAVAAVGMMLLTGGFVAVAPRLCHPKSLTTTVPTTPDRTLRLPASDNIAT